MAVDQCLRLLKEAYIGGEKTKWELTKWEDTGDTSLVFHTTCLVLYDFYLCSTDLYIDVYSPF